MNRRTRRNTIAFICICLLLSFWARAGVCVCEDGGAAALPLNERVCLPAGETRLALTADQSGEYTLISYGSEAVQARITVGDELLAFGNLPLSFRLIHGQTALTEFDAKEACALEWMRAALGRSALMPLDMGEETLSRSFTHAHDVHWLRFTAQETGEYLLCATRAAKNGVLPLLEALDADGNTLGDPHPAEDTSAAFVRLAAGESCLIRVCAQDDLTGACLVSVRQAPDEPQALSWNRDELDLQAGQWLHIDVEPSEFLIWESDDPTIATVNGAGVVAAQGVGSCTVTVYGPGGETLSLPVRVRPAEVTGVTFDDASMALSVGEEVFVSYSVLPAFARDVQVCFSSADETVARISADGLLTAVGEGETEITVRTLQGDFSHQMTVSVCAPRSVRRALAVGIASYADGRSRMGSVNTTQGVVDALSQSRYGENAYQTAMRVDLTRKELTREIETVFADATERDISLFYINCHGNVFSGMPFLEMYDGSRVSARELESMLRQVPGTVVVVLDCCFSGAFIGQAAAADSFTHGVIEVFSSASATDGENAFASSKYKVLVSSSQDQNSYRMSSSSPAVESSMSTVFSRALTEAVGWDLIKDQPTVIRADLDDDRRVTLNEACLYLQRRTMYYLTRSSASTARQYAQVFPEGDSFLLIG